MFRSNDRKFRGVQVPAEFWKVVAWRDKGTLRSLAMIANQKKVIEVWPEALDGREEFGAPDELDKVEDFLTTVADIEKATGLDFGDEVRDADINEGAENRRRVASLEDIRLQKRAGASKRRERETV